MKKKIVVSPKYSFKGWNLIKLLSNHRNGVIATFAALVFVVLFLKMLTSPTVYNVMQIVAEPAAAAGAAWTMLHGWLYFKSEQRQ